MYMRLLQLNVKPEAVEMLHRFYDNRVIPALQTVKGCMSAKLMRSNQQPETFISMTLWQAITDAKAYETGELFPQLMKELDSFLSESSEWRIHLSDNQELTYGPVKEEPVINSYPIKAKKEIKTSVRQEMAPMCMRIVSTKVKKGKLEELNRIYEQEVIPALQAADGCLYAYLAENLEESGVENEEVFSVTIWENQEKAEQYAASGLFDQLVKKIQHTFSQLSQWNLSLDKGEGNQIKTSDDLSIKRYSIVTGKQFE